MENFSRDLETIKENKTDILDRSWSLNSSWPWLPSHRSFVFCLVSLFLLSGRVGPNCLLHHSWKLNSCNAPFRLFSYLCFVRKFQACLVFLSCAICICCPCCISLKNNSVVLGLKAVCPDFRFSFHVHGILLSFFRISTVEISVVRNSSTLKFSLSKFSRWKILFQLIDHCFSSWVF